MNRPTWPEYFMEVAETIAKRSTCPRAQVGAVLVRNNQIIVTGYNGSVSGLAHCTDEGCHIVNNHCMRVVHAEMNAITNCAKQGGNIDGADLYVTHFPCIRCLPLVLQSGVKRIYYKHDYNVDPFCKDLIKAANINCTKMN